jgi:hypothetical protein
MEEKMKKNEQKLGDKPKKRPNMAKKENKVLKTKKGQGLKDEKTDNRPVKKEEIVGISETEIRKATKEGTTDLIEVTVPKLVDEDENKNWWRISEMMNAYINKDFAKIPQEAWSVLFWNLCKTMVGRSWTTLDLIMDLGVIGKKFDGEWFVLTRKRGG